MNKAIHKKRVLICGGTGSLGQAVLRRLLDGKDGKPEKIILFSRDEAKQHAIRTRYLRKPHATDEIIYHNFSQLLEFHIGDVRDMQSLIPVLSRVDTVINAAAMKQVPTCEYFPEEAIKTNVLGSQNIVNAIQNHRLPVEAVICTSSDKACKPVNVMGMTKALQERIIINANLNCPGTRFINARYGNVMASRGSVIPLFLEQVRSGRDVTITDARMTRFMISLDDAVDTVFHALETALPGETYVPAMPSARIEDVAKAMIGNRKVKLAYTGIRPGEKLHEIVVSEEETIRTIKRGDYYVICPVLPEIRKQALDPKHALTEEYSSSHVTLDVAAIMALLTSNQLMPDSPPIELA